MERMELEELVQSLEKRIEQLERRQSRFLVGASVPQEDIRTRTLSIVDSNGVARLVLGAPVPNPVVGGKTGQRRTPAIGIIFNDSAGNERGGIAMLEDGYVNLCFDDAKRERNCLFFMPKLGNGIVLNDASGNDRAILYLDTNGAPHLILQDEKGKPLVSLPETLKGFE